MKKKKKINLPPIGLRIIKSAVAVFLCYIVNYLRDGSGIVFYSQLSALWCMQDYATETKNNAKQRFHGTVIGALFGLLVLIISKSVNFSEIPAYFFNAGIVSISIVLIIYSTVLVKRRNASYFSCVVFLSIVVNHTNDANPYMFVLNRVLDTMIGIAIGVAVNSLELHREKNRNILFLSGLDDTLLSDNNNLSGYSKVELNRMLDDGLNFTISTVRTPASLMEPLKDIKLKLPVIVMDGAALYNIKEKSFEKVYYISKEESTNLSQYMQERKISYFTNIVIDDTVLIYYEDSDNPVYNSIVSELRRSPYRNYIKRPAPNEGVVYFMFIEETERVMNLYEEMKAAGFEDKFRITITHSHDHKGYSYLKIYNHNALKENMLDYLLQQINVEKVITFGTIKDKYTYLITPGDTNRVVRMIKKAFRG